MSGPTPNCRGSSSCLQDSESVIAVVEGRAEVATRQPCIDDRTRHLPCTRATSAAPASILLGDITTVDDEVKSMTGRVIFRSDDSIVEVDKILGAGAAQFADATRHQLVDPGPLAARDPIQDLLDLRARRAAGTISESDYQAARSRLLDEL